MKNEGSCHWNSKDRNNKQPWSSTLIEIWLLYNPRLPVIGSNESEFYCCCCETQYFDYLNYAFTPRKFPGVFAASAHSPSWKLSLVSVSQTTQVKIWQLLATVFYDTPQIIKIEFCLQIETGSHYARSSKRANIWPYAW